MEEVDDRSRFVSALPLDSRQIADSEGVKLPHQLKAHVVTAEPLVHAAVRPQAENSGLEVHAGGLKTVEHEHRQDGAIFLPIDIRLRRQDQRPSRGDLRAVVDGDPHQVLGGLVGIDQSYL